MLRGAMYRASGEADLRFAEKSSGSGPVVAEQRRKAARLPITLPATIRQLDDEGTPFGEERQLVTRDISIGGFAVGTGVGGFSPGAHVQFELILTSGEMLSGTAVVVRAASEMSGLRFESSPRPTASSSRASWPAGSRAAGRGPPRARGSRARARGAMAALPSPQVAHEPRDVRVARVARRRPQPDRVRLVVGDEGGHATRALRREVPLAGAHERERDAVRRCAGSTASRYMFPRHPSHAAISTPTIARSGPRSATSSEPGPVSSSRATVCGVSGVEPRRCAPAPQREDRRDVGAVRRSDAVGYGHPSSSLSWSRKTAASASGSRVSSAWIASISARIRTVMTSR